MILFYSACGNSRFVADELARLTNDRLVNLVDCLGQSSTPQDEEHSRVGDKPHFNLAEGEALGIVCPVYAWAVPRLVADFLLGMSLNRKPSYCYLACTCGDSVGRTPERLGRTLGKKGWQLDAAFSFVMPETYINLPGFNLDTADNAARKISAVRRRLPEVASLIIGRKRVVDVARGKVPRLNTYVTNPLFYGLLIGDKKFRVTNECISCGQCEELCPLGNITLEEGQPHWHGNCTNCMACYHHCPQNAIHFGKATLGKGQYYFK